MNRHAATLRLRHLADTGGVRIRRMHPHMLRHTTVMLHGIPPSSKIGTEKMGQKYAMAKSGVIDAFVRNTRRMTRCGPCSSKALAANNVDRLRNMYASPSP
jgi:hypothetical protein